MEVEKVEKRLKEGWAKLLESKTMECEKIGKELKKTKEYVNASMERSRGTAPGVVEKHSTSQVKVVRVNNFISGGSSSKGGRA